MYYLTVTKLPYKTHKIRRLNVLSITFVTEHILVQRKEPVMNKLAV